MIHPDVEAADAIVQAVKNGAVGSVLTFDNSDLELARISVFEGSPFDGVSLKNIRSITDLKFLVAYVEQNGKTQLASGNTVITGGSTLGVLLDKKDVPGVLALCGSKQKELKKVALIGAGRIGTIIAEKLIDRPQKSNGFAKLFTTAVKRRGQKFAIIDTNENLTKAAANRFPDAQVFTADASDENFLREEEITSYDLAICVTHNHELNMVLAAYLESLGVGQSISLVESAAFAVIAEKLGVDVSVPLRDCVVDSIMSHLRGKSVKEIHTITTGELEIVECEISSSSKVNGKSLKEISDPGKYLVLLRRSAGSDTYEIPTGDTRLYSGDHVVLLSESENSKKILSSFTGINS